MALHVVNIGNESANFYLVFADGRPRIMIDCGWAKAMGRLKNSLARLDVELSMIRFVMVTHFHPDHAGLVKELKEAGLTLLVYESQLPLPEESSNPLNLTERYLEARQKDGLILRAGHSREFLKGIGIDGEVVPTPGHTHDSVSLILDAGLAFTGDLFPESMLSQDDSEARESWGRIRDRGVRTVYPGHGPVFALGSTP